jgi:hypothetical protein
MGEHGDLTRLDPGGRGSQVVATRTRYGVPPSCPAVPGVVRFQHQTESTDRLSASPARKSHSKSQRRPVSGDTQLRQATVEAGQVPSEPSPATPGHAREVTGGQGVAGSNPAVPTRRSRSEGVPGCGPGPFSIFGSQPGSHLTPVHAGQRPG